MFRKTYENPEHPEVAAIEDTVPIPAHADLKGARVLVVDDERDARSMIAMALQGCGAIVETTHTIDEAISLATNHAFDAIVTDLAMPTGDGFSLLRGLRMRLKNMPVIALSAMRGPDIEKQVHDAGFALHIDKPIEVSYLTAAVADVIWNSKNRG